MKFIFTCGGTAGHINPAIAVAGRLRELMPDSEFLFIGANGKMEMDLVPRDGYEIKGLHITNISRGHHLSDVIHNLDTIKNVALSRHEAKRIISEFRPDAVIGTGGYVCYPVLMAAAEMHIPTLVHESNAVPGLTTKMLSEHVRKIMVGFEESRQQYHHPDRVVVTGTPVRGEFDRFTKAQAKRELGLDPEEKLVVSVWGSLGAGFMNARVAELIPMLDGSQNFHFLHAAGKMYYKGLRESLGAEDEELKKRKVEVREYIFDMPRVMAAADLIMCRAGASTLSELSFMGKPVILIPSPNVTNNHQEKNARVLERAGGAKVLLEGEFSSEQLIAEISKLLSDDAALTEMSENIRKLAVRDSTERICGMILDEINKK